MLQVLRRAGIAIGSLVAASLCVSLVGGVFMGIAGVNATPASWGIGAVVTLVLGGLIYRDIVRRERPKASTA